MDETVVIFRTGQLFEIDMASNHLKEAGIPHFTQEVLASGIRLAMPASPSTGPGVWWNIRVPASWEERAREKLLELPFTEKKDPSVWDFQPTAKVKTGWRIYVAVFVLLPLGWQVLQLARYYLRPPPTTESVTDYIRARYPNVTVQSVRDYSYRRSSPSFRVFYVPLGTQSIGRASDEPAGSSFTSTEPAGTKDITIDYKKAADGSWKPTPDLPPFLN